jgi:hypothetical protein
MRRRLDGDAPTEVFGEDITGGHTGYTQSLRQPMSQAFSVNSGVRVCVLSRAYGKVRGSELKQG